jgi:hypothetical protein
MRMTLTPGQSVPMNLAGKYLICRKVQSTILISSPDNGMGDTEVRQSDNINLEGFKSIFVKNDGAIDADIDLQSSMVPIAVNDGGSVVISGGSIDSIVEPIQVTASATVEDGTVTNLSHTSLEQSNDIAVPGNSTVTVLVADNVSFKRTVNIQNISATETLLRVGGNAVAANQGAIIKGSMDAIASWESDNLGVIKVHNESASAAKVSISWGVK